MRLVANTVARPKSSIYYVSRRTFTIGVSVVSFSNSWTIIDEVIGERLDQSIVVSISFDDSTNVRATGYWHAAACRPLGPLNVPELPDPYHLCAVGSDLNESSKASQAIHQEHKFSILRYPQFHLLMVIHHFQGHLLISICHLDNFVSTSQPWSQLEVFYQFQRCHLQTLNCHLLSTNSIIS